jgi:hypothetical protein
VDDRTVAIDEPVAERLTFATVEHPQHRCVLHGPHDCELAAPEHDELGPGCAQVLVVVDVDPDQIVHGVERGLVLLQEFSDSV